MGTDGLRFEELSSMIWKLEFHRARCSRLFRFHRRSFNVTGSTEAHKDINHNALSPQTAAHMRRDHLTKHISISQWHSKCRGCSIHAQHLLPSVNCSAGCTSLCNNTNQWQCCMLIPAVPLLCLCDLWNFLRVIRLAGFENFICEWEKSIFNAFINIEPVQRCKDGCNVTKFRSFNHSTCIRARQSSESAGGDFIWDLGKL